MQQPCVRHYHAVQHVLRYVQRYPDLAILLDNSTNFTLSAYCDSDWASCSHTRKSVSGYVVFLEKSLISWESKKQGTIALFPAEAEYRSLKRVVAELAWLTRLFHELTVSAITPIPIKCDNQAAIYIAKNPFFHERTKHIEIDCHFIQEKLLDGLISLSCIPTRLQLADVLTKPLPGPSHHYVLSKLGVQAPTNLRGVIYLTLRRSNLGPFTCASVLRPRSLAILEVGCRSVMFMFWQ